MEKWSSKSASASEKNSQLIGELFNIGKRRIYQYPPARDASLALSPLQFAAGDNIPRCLFKAEIHAASVHLSKWMLVRFALVPS